MLMGMIAIGIAVMVYVLVPEVKNKVNSLLGIKDDSNK